MKVFPATSTYVDRTVESLDDESHDMALANEPQGWEVEKGSPTQPANGMRY
jgi:hypothetical protein